MSECRFAWRDGWGEHTCARSGAHNLHLCRCDASRVRESSRHETARFVRIGNSVFDEAEVPSPDEVAS